MKMIRELARGRFFGHPVHAMLVHFPTALFSLSLVFDLWGMFGHEPELFKASLYSILLGLLGGISAGVFGFIDYIHLAERVDLFRKASWHAGLQVCVLAVFGVIAGIRLQDYPDPVEPGLGQLVFMGVAIVAMLAGNYLGGDLVFRDGVGVHDR